MYRNNINLRYFGYSPCFFVWVKTIILTVSKVEYVPDVRRAARYKKLSVN